MSPQHPATALHSIGAVSRLTNVSASTLRTWERRHGAVTPTRTPGGGRRYTAADVERIQLLAALTGAGEAIGAIAAASTDALRSRVAALRPTSTSVGGPTRLLVLHRSLGPLLDEAEPDGFMVTRAKDDAALPGTDVALLELALMGHDPVATLDRVQQESGASFVVVDYSFATVSTLEALAEAGALVVRGPLSQHEALRVIGGYRRRLPPPWVTSSSREAPPGPTFSIEQLARLRELDVRNPCECPAHLSLLVASLREFEAYCGSCVSENRKDAELHEALGAGTGRARAVLETLLTQLCAYEGIEV